MAPTAPSVSSTARNAAEHAAPARLSLAVAAPFANPSPCTAAAASSAAYTPSTAVISPAAAASSAVVRGRTPGLPSLALRPTMRACDARRLVILSSPGVPTSHAGSSSCGARVACSPCDSAVPAPCRRRGTHCRPSATMAACNGHSCGSRLLIDSATAVRSDLPCTTVSLAG
eukprot:1405561-Pleurochrysis_carterae.AAC.1